MAKRVGPGSSDPKTEETPNPRGVVDLADARVRLRLRHPSEANLVEELDHVRSLLDQGLSTEARTRLTSLITAAGKSPTILALARCSLANALEMQGHYRESLASVAMYETPESRAGLDEEAGSCPRVQS